MKDNTDCIYLTPKEVANLLMVSPVTVRYWAQKGDLKASTTHGGHRRFLKSDVDDFAAGNKMELRESDKTRILIVDDDRALAGFLLELFEVSQDQFDIEVVHDGFTAGSFIQSFQPHIVLIDIMMPGVNGIEVCRFLKDNEETRHIQLIAMTGYPSPNNVENILAAGARECLKKPLNVSQLMHSIYAASN